MMARVDSSKASSSNTSQTTSEVTEDLEDQDGRHLSLKAIPQRPSTPSARPAATGAAPLEAKEIAGPSTPLEVPSRPATVQPATADNATPNPETTEDMRDKFRPQTASASSPSTSYLTSMAELNQLKQLPT
jgi:hypothetical protein